MLPLQNLPRNIQYLYLGCKNRYLVHRDPAHFGSVPPNAESVYAQIAAMKKHYIPPPLQSVSYHLCTPYFHSVCGISFFSLHRAREERLDSVALRDRDEKRKSLFGKQAMMDKDARAIGKKAVTPKILSRSSAAPPTISVSNGKGEEPFRKPGLPEEYLGPTAWKAPAQDANAAPSQPLLLSMPQRAYAVGVVACCALAFGRGTSDALEKGFLSPDVVDVAGTASLFLVGLNVASAMAGAAIAKSKGRSVPLWAFKGSLAGLTSVCEVKGLPDFVLPATLKADDDPSAA